MADRFVFLITGFGEPRYFWSLTAAAKAVRACGGDFETIGALAIKAGRIYDTSGRRSVQVGIVVAFDDVPAGDRWQLEPAIEKGGW